MSRRIKAGIITYWESKDNYGQQLQCWALQRVLREMEVEPYLIRFKRKQPRKTIKRRVKDWRNYTLSVLCALLGIKRADKVLTKLRGVLDVDIINRKFFFFRAFHLKKSFRIYPTLADIQSKPPLADIYITGSDQVWNFDLTDEELRAYFLQFGEKHVRRIAYAPSIGHAEIPGDLLPMYRDNLLDFSGVSLRDNKPCEQLKNLGINALTVLDPSLLLPPVDYNQLLNKESSTVPHSIFIYSLNYSSPNDIPFEEIKAYSEQKGIPILVTTGSGYTPAKELFSDVEYHYATIPEWLSIIRNAELVVTASFHGIVFSILYQRPFVFTPLAGRLSSLNERVYSLLETLSLTHRIWNENKSFCDYLLPIDWTEPYA